MSMISPIHKTNKIKIYAAVGLPKPVKKIGFIVFVRKILLSLSVLINNTFFVFNILVYWHDSVKSLSLLKAKLVSQNEDLMKVTVWFRRFIHIRIPKSNLIALFEKSL